MMCDALGTIIVNHLSRFDLAAEVSVIRKEMGMILALVLRFLEWNLITKRFQE